MSEEADREVIEGIKPEDVQAIPHENLAKIVREVAGTITPPTSEDNDPQIELLDSEIMAATKLLMELQFKYKHRPPSFENLTSLRGEAKYKFDKIGLAVEVTWADPTQPPTIEIIGRTKEFDIDRQHYDVNKGVADEYWERQRRRK